MKKILLLFAVIFLMTGCDVHKTYETYEVVSGVDLKVVYLEVRDNAWETVNNPDEGCFLYQTFDNVPEITQKVLNNGAVLAYLIESDGEIERENILPYVFPLDNGVMKNIRFDYSLGEFTVISEWSDSHLYAGGNCLIKVCILYNVK